MNNITKPPAIFLMGPTASGKTTLSVQLAQQLNAEIISVDSALVFKGMDIGTAKPSLEERAGIPHHLIDILDPSECYSTGTFRNNALTLMAEISARGKIPLLVGGTLLYFNALYHGIATLPTADTAVRQQLTADLLTFGHQWMHDKLAAVDPVAAKRIHPNDSQRVQRGLEVYTLTGKSLTQLQQAAQETPIPYQKIKLVLAPKNRIQLHQTIALRFQKMLKMGFIEEVKQLYQRGDLTADMPSIRAVGYRQVWDYLANNTDYDTMQEHSIIATRQLAKRQFTWLRKETDACHIDSESKQVFKHSLDYIRSVL